MTVSRHDTEPLLHSERRLLAAMQLLLRLKMIKCQLLRQTPLNKLNRAALQPGKGSIWLSVSVNRGMAISGWMNEDIFGENAGGHIVDRELHAWTRMRDGRGMARIG